MAVDKVGGRALGRPVPVVGFLLDTPVVQWRYKHPCRQAGASWGSEGS